MDFLPHNNIYQIYENSTVVYMKMYDSNIYLNDNNIYL
jgi:hypothetical protein